MKMRNLLLPFILGLLAVVHSTSLNTATQIPAHSNEVLNEAQNEGFLITDVHVHSQKTDSPKGNTTSQPSQHPLFEVTSGESRETSNTTESKGADFTITAQSISEFISEGSGESPSTTESNTGGFTTTARSIWEFTSEGSGESPSTTESSNGDFTTTAQSILKSTSEGSGASQSTTESSTGGFTTTAQSILKSTSEESGASQSTTESSTGGFTTTAQSILKSTSEGSGASQPTTESRANSKLNASWTHVEKRVKSRMLNDQKQAIPVKDDQLSREEQKLKNTENSGANYQNGHSTPDWIIILGFIVGLAALVIVFAAIATRDKWLGPKNLYKVETKTNASDQMREPEKQTFLLKQEPKENWKEAEYTVIPLDELPEKFSSD